MTDEQLRILDSRMLMMALSLMAATLYSQGRKSLEECITTSRQIVFDARTTADSGNYR